MIILHSNIRLFPFGKDDFASGTMENPINDGAYYHVKIVKKDRTFAVYVDEVKWLEHTFDTVEAFFENGHVGIGLWDGALDIQNFFVMPIAYEPESFAITKQPEDVSATLGESFCVEVIATGEGLKYQWYYRSVDSENWYISGQCDNTYDDVMTKARHNRQVKCVITDMWGNSVESDVATITATVSQPLTVINQPADVSAANGENFCVTVEAQGDGLTYTWYFRNAGSKTWNKSGVKDNTYDDVMTDSRAGRQVYCVVADILGNTVTTDTVTLIRQQRIGKISKD